MANIYSKCPLFLLFCLIRNEKFASSSNSLVVAFLNRKHVVFGKLVQGFEVLKKIENVGEEDGSPAVTVKIINCGEFREGKNLEAVVSGD